MTKPRYYRVKMKTFWIWVIAYACVHGFFVAVALPRIPTLMSEFYLVAFPGLTLVEGTDTCKAVRIGMAWESYKNRDDAQAIFDYGRAMHRYGGINTPSGEAGMLLAVQVLETKQDWVMKYLDPYEYTMVVNEGYRVIPQRAAIPALLRLPGGREVWGMKGG